MGDGNSRLPRPKPAQAVECESSSVSVAPVPDSLPVCDPVDSPFGAAGAAGAAACRESAPASAPERNIELCADGSLRADLGVGAWAFTARLADGGCEPGNRVEHFELMGVIEGLRALAGFATTHVHIVTDCEHTSACLRSILDSASRQGPTAAAFPRDGSAALREAVRQLGPQVKISVRRPEKTSTAHKWCHKEARRRLQEFIRHSEVYRERALREQLDTLRRERDTVLKTLRKFEARIAAAEAELKGKEESNAGALDD